MCKHYRLAYSAFSLVVMGLALATRADIIFNNFGPGDSFSDSGRLLQGEAVGTIGNVDQAVSFKVGANSYRLTNISIGIFVDTPPNVGTGPIDILLAQDSGNGPGATLRTFPLNATLTGKQILSVADNATLQLDANTTYWVIADARGSFDGSWNSNTVGDLGLTAGRSDNGPWNLRPDDDRMALRVEGRVVPEPSSLALLGMGAGVVGLVRRRPRRV